MQFSGGHVFRYSMRDGTAAAKFPNQVDGKTSKMRAKIINAAIKASEEKYLSSFIGREVDVLWEASGVQSDKGWTLHGLADYYMKVEALADSNRWNKLDKVRIETIKNDSLIGKISKFD